MTAVEWLINNLPERFKNAIINTCVEDIEQAKKMEEKQHNSTFLAGGRSAFNASLGRDFATFEEYYEETYKKE